MTRPGTTEREAGFLRVAKSAGVRFTEVQEALDVSERTFRRYVRETPPVWLECFILGLGVKFGRYRPEKRESAAGTALS